MHQVQLAAQVYERAKRLASEAGFANVDDYIADVVASDFTEKTANLDHLFTSDRLAHIDRVRAEFKADGKVHSMDEIRQFLRETRADWIGKNGK